MPRPSHRTRSKKRVYKQLPHHNKSLLFKRRPTATRICHVCQQPLAGIKHVSRLKLTKLDRSKRRIRRLYGGQICHNCLQLRLKQAARSISH